jgi:hypothetical protein
MYRLRRTAVFLAASSGLTLAATGIVPVQAAPTAARAPKPGQWTQVTGKLTIINDIGLARGKDGVLHVTDQNRPVQAASPARRSVGLAACISPLTSQHDMLCST